MEANKGDEDCSRYRQAIEKGRKALHGVKLGACTVKDGVLWHGNQLWVPGNVALLLELIRESHDPSVCGHPGVARTVEILRRYYYWPNMHKVVKQYVRNCRTCNRSKAPRDTYNGLLVPSAIVDERWQDIAMDFIIGLLTAKGYNAICTLIDKLTKERHYAPCTTNDEGTTAEATAMILLNYLFRTHDIPKSITSNRGPQFIATVWKSLCRRLGIKCNLSIAFHSEIDGQTERANQDVETNLRKYCNYMQDDWPDWLPMAEFFDNDRLFEATKLTPFFANKGFHPRMAIGPDDIAYESTRERLLAKKAGDITGTMANILEFMKGNIKKVQAAMTAQANKHRKFVSYAKGDMVWLSSRNIKTIRPSKKLDDKMLGPYEVLKRVGAFYRLKLPPSMKIWNSFHPNLLRKNLDDLMDGQVPDAPRPVETDNGDEWLVDDILDSRYHGRGKRLQYRVKWNGFDRDHEWYNTDRGEFNNATDVVQEYHRKNLDKSGRR